MATDKEILDAIKKFTDSWNITRSGIIVSLTGAKSGSWLWRDGTLIVKPEDDNFKKDFRQLVKNGIIVREPTKRLQSPDSEDVDPGDATVSRIINVSDAAPAQMDSALKVMGYFMLETNLPLNISKSTED